MSEPNIKLMAVSNVYSRLMHFVRKGDVELGHRHTYDHGTLVSTGSLLVEMMDDQGAVLSSKIFVAPTFVFVDKNRFHKLTALEDNTVAVCIHALHDDQGDLVEPDFFVESTTLARQNEETKEAPTTLIDDVKKRGLKGHQYFVSEINPFTKI